MKYNIGDNVLVVESSMRDMGYTDGFILGYESKYEAYIVVTNGLEIYMREEHLALDTKVSFPPEYTVSEMQLDPVTGEQAQCNSDGTLVYSGYSLCTDELKQCAHEYKEYIGLMNRFEYCVKCDKKKE